MAFSTSFLIIPGTYSLAAFTNGTLTTTNNNLTAVGNISFFDNVTTTEAAAGANVTVSATYISRIFPSVMAMVILFVLSALGNITVFLALVTSRSRKTRISIIILHLTIADLFVTFILIPTEVSEA